MIDENDNIQTGVSKNDRSHSSALKDVTNSTNGSRPTKRTRRS